MANRTTYLKHFTFYKDAPVDRQNIDVAGNLEVLESAIEDFAFFSRGVRVAGSLLGEKERWASMNFSPLQTELYIYLTSLNAEYKEAENFLGANYLKVEFFTDITITATTPPPITYYYFINDAKPVDTEQTGDIGRTIYLSLTLDAWATNLLANPNARFFGGTITGASRADLAFFPHTANPYNTPANVPFDTKTPFGIETRGEVFDNNYFCAVVQLTGKNLGRAVLCCSPATQLNNAVSIAQAITNVPRMGYQRDGEYVREFAEGELKVQGAFVVPASLCPWRTFDDVAENGGAFYPITGGGLEPAPWVIAEIETPTEKTVTSTAEQSYFDATGYYIDETDYNPSVRVTVGTAFNRVDITEYTARKTTRGFGDAPPDLKLRAFWGVNSFNVFMIVTGTVERDITSDFQVFAVVDPENDYIRQNKTNAILSSIGSAGAIVGGVAALATGGGAGVGLGMIAGGVSGVVRTASDFAVASNAPDVITSGGYGDVTNSRGGVYYEFLYVPAWVDIIAMSGIKRNLQILGEFFLFRNNSPCDVNAVAIDGASVRGMPAGDAEEISNMLRGGVRIWYTVDGYTNRSI